MEKENLYTPYRWLMLMSVSIAMISIYIHMTDIAPLLGEIAQSLDVNMGAATNLMTVMVASVACVMIFGGTVCDKYGITTALVMGLLLSGIASVCYPLIGSSYGIVVFLRILQGAAIGIIFAVIGPVIAIWFPPKEQGLASGLLIGSLSVGTAVGVWLGPVFFNVSGSWQSAVAILSVFNWIAIVFALLFTRRKPSPAVLQMLGSALAGQQGDLSFKQALSMPITWIGTALCFINAWAFFGLINLVPAYLASEAPMGVGLGPVLAGKMSFALSITGIFAMVIGGIFFDKVAKGNARIAVYIGFVLTAVFGYLLLAPSVYGAMSLLVICLVLAGWGLPFMNPGLSAFVAINYPPGIVGRMMGIWFGIGSFGPVLSLYFSGVLIAQTGRFNGAIILLCLASVIGLVIGYFLRMGTKPAVEAAATSKI